MKWKINCGELYVELFLLVLPLKLKIRLRTVTKSRRKSESNTSLRPFQQEPFREMDVISCSQVIIRRLGELNNGLNQKLITDINTLDGSILVNNLIMS